MSHTTRKFTKKRRKPIILEQLIPLEKQQFWGQGFTFLALHKKDVARGHVFAEDHAEDVSVLQTVCQGQFNLHGVVIGIGEKAVLLDVLDG